MRSTQEVVLLGLLATLSVVSLPSCDTLPTLTVPSLVFSRDCGALRPAIRFPEDVSRDIWTAHLVKRSLRLRGGSRSGRGSQDIQYSKKKIESEQGRALAQRKQSWRQRFGESESDDLSNEEVTDPDRPDYYKRPLPAAPEDDFSRSGLPAFLDPIYDDVEPEEYLKAEMQEEGGNQDDIGWEADIDSSDLLEERVDSETGEPTLALKPLPGDEWFSDKEFTFSELEEMERIWNWNERHYGKREKRSEDSDEAPPLAALPWEAEEDEKSRRQRSLADNMLPLEHLPVFQAQSPAPSLLLRSAAQHTSDTDAGVDVLAGEAIEDSAGEGKGASAGGLEAGARGGSDDGAMEVDAEDSGASSQRPEETVAAGADGARPEQAITLRDDDDDDDYARELNYTAMIESAKIYADRYREEGAGAALWEWDQEQPPQPPPPQYENDNWPYEPGVCAPDRHPLEYQVSDERLRYYSMNWLKQDYERTMANFSIPEHERQRQEKIEKEWGFCPEPNQVIPGFCAWNTTMPPPPSPAVGVKAGDVVVPDRCSSIPQAVQACADGGRVVVRGSSNHTWIGPGTRKRSGRMVDRYDRAMMETVRPEAEQETLLGALTVPAAGAAPPAIDVLGAEYKPPGLDSFCMHLAATPGGAIGGCWLLQAWSLGSFTGAECVFEVNMSKPELTLQPLLSTLEIRGGPWLLQQCGLRSCGAVAVDCTRRSLVKLRQCAIGGISHRRDAHAAGGRAVIGVFCRDFCRCVMLHCTVEQTGWFYMPAVRCAGVAQVAVQSCVLQRNTYAIGILDSPTVQLSNCSTKENMQAAFVAQEYKGEVNGGAPPPADEARMQDRAWEFDAAPRDRQYPIPKLAEQKVVWDREQQEWVLRNTRPTVRIDPLFGNLTDGWANGLPGWTHGVPSKVREAVDEAAERNPLSLFADSFLRWGSGSVGCVVSQMIANGSLPGDQLAIGFNGGAHEAKLVVADCVVHGDLWGTRGRPGTLHMRNVTLERDAWIEKYYGNATERPTTRMRLEAMGLRWDKRKRTYFKPVRMVNGTVVYVRWNETRFSDEADGGYPGGPADYPMFDPETQERLFSHNMSKKTFSKKYPLLGYEEKWHEDDAAMWEHKRQKAVRKQARALARKKSAAAAGRVPSPDPNDGDGRAIVRAEGWREAAILKLADKFMSRPTRQDPRLEAVDPPPLLHTQPR